MGHTSTPPSVCRRRVSLDNPDSPFARRRTDSAAATTTVLARRIVCVPRHAIATHVSAIVRVFVDAERREAHTFVDSELIDRLGSSYEVVAELIVQLLERQRQVVHLQRRLDAADLRRTDATTPSRPTTPVNA